MEMQLVETPAIRPHLCVDGSQAGPVVDTMITHPAYGRMYWPKRLVVEAARLYGMVPREEHDAAVEAATGLAVRVAELEGEVAELQPVRDAISRASSRYEDEPPPPKPPAPPKWLQQRAAA